MIKLHAEVMYAQTPRNSLKMVLAELVQIIKRVKGMENSVGQTSVVQGINCLMVELAKSVLMVKKFQMMEKVVLVTLVINNFNIICVKMADVSNALYMQLWPKMV